MKESGIGKAYAKAILDISLEKNKSDEFGEELSEVVSSLKSNSEIWEFLVSPRVTKKAKDDALEKAFAGKIDQSLLSLIHILVRNDRIPFVEEISEKYKELNDIRKGVIRAEIHSATKLQDSIVSEVKSWCQKTFNGSSCVIKEVIKPELIGGIIVKKGDMVFDYSIRRKLTSIKSHIIGDMQTLLSADKIGAYYEN
ncbi:MAG: ATP synthase F1 subunit delta [Leptospiraceae bacterium]|nr:ATP synthase F1 subunit delta [Leptospiraceae bacterium]